MKNIRKLIALALIAVTLFTFAAPALAASPSAQIDYVATSVSVVGTTVKIKGYFQNNTSKTVSNFTDFDMTLWQGRSKILAVEFDALQYFSLAPGGRINYDFTVTNVYGLNPGYYFCSQHGIYADCAFTYSYRYR